MLITEKNMKFHTAFKVFSKLRQPCKTLYSALYAPWASKSNRISVCKGIPAVIFY